MHRRQSGSAAGLPELHKRHAGIADVDVIPDLRSKEAEA